jgi:hypothetical protein
MNILAVLQMAKKKNDYKHTYKCDEVLLGNL